MPHLHLSLQSGSDKILRKMARHYSAEDYLDKVQMIKTILDKPAITTDIIVGFPGETDDDFEDTIAFARKVGFSRIHVFSFSPRKGTAAEKMKPVVRPEVIKIRASRLQKTANELAYEYRQQFVGRSERILIENANNGTAFGRAERYFEVEITNPDHRLRKNQIVEITLAANSTGVMTGEF
jgi:threonylcarbamoyladenosine tRNA methylthiotransferase MtaB